MELHYDEAKSVFTNFLKEDVRVRIILPSLSKSPELDRLPGNGEHGARLLTHNGEFKCNRGAARVVHGQIDGFQQRSS